MTNALYNHSDGAPVSQTRGTSATFRAEFDLIGAGFDAVSNSVMGVATESGTLNNYVLTLTPQPTAYPTKGTACFIATHANTGAATLQIGALSTIPLLANDGTALTSNYIKSGELVTVFITATNAYMLGATKSYVDSVALNSSYPAQAGNGGKFITTDGSSAGWGNTVSLLSTGNGTVGAPSFNLGDAATGLYRPAVNQLGFSVAGVLAMLIDASKNATLYANLTLGTSARLLGDFSNATAASQTAVQSSTTNGSTNLALIPNGSGANASLSLEGDSAVANGSLGQMALNGAVDFRIQSGKRGTGAYLPMTFFTGGAVQMTIDTSGNVSLTTPLAVASGGTGANAAANAPFALKGANGDLTSLTALASINGGQLAGLRNRIINGNFDVWQRGIAITPTLGSQYLADRFYVYTTGAAATTVQQITGGVGDGTPRYALTMIGTAGNTVANIGQRIEAANAASLTGKVVTLSAWVYTSDSRLVIPSLGYSTVADNFTTVTNISPTSTTSVSATGWRRITSLFTVPATQNGLEVNFVFGATLAGVQVAITQVQLELGSVATAFEQRPYGIELALCQRYYQVDVMYVPDVGNLPTNWFFKVTMRTTPTIGGGNAGYATFGTTAAAVAHRQTAAATATVTASAEL